MEIEINALRLLPELLKFEWAMLIETFFWNVLIFWQRRGEVQACNMQYPKKPFLFLFGETKKVLTKSKFCLESVDHFASNWA